MGATAATGAIACGKCVVTKTALRFFYIRACLVKRQWACVRPEGEDPVLVQDQALNRRLGVVNFRGGLGEKKSRHDVGNDARTPVVEFRADRLAVRLIGDAQDRTGMGVIDEFVREECVQQRLDRGVGRCWLEQALPLDAYHLFVAQRCACAQLAQAVEPHGR